MDQAKEVKDKLFLFIESSLTQAEQPEGEVTVGCGDSQKTYLTPKATIIRP